MINYLMTSAIHAWNLFHGWVRRIIHNEGGEGSGESFVGEIDRNSWKLT
jgi:hypothetical protein